MALERYFPVGGPVSEDDIIDREVFLENVTRRLADGQNLLLAGARRIGKTSLALEVLRRLARDGHDVAFVDLFGVTSLREMSEHLADALLQNRTGVGGTVERIRDLVKTASGANVRLAAQGLELGVSFANRQGTDLDLLEEAFQITDQLARHSNHRVILVFDEFQELSRLGPHLHKVLRSHLQLKPHVSCLFLGSKPALLEQLFSRDNEAFFRYAISIPVPKIPDEAWSYYLLQKFTVRGLAITPAEVRALLMRTGGHPQDTMLVASEAYYVALEVQSDTVSLTILELAYSRALAGLARAFEALWESLGEHKEAQVLLKKIASGDRPYSGDGAAAAVGRALNYLMNQNVLVKVGRGQYQFFEPMFGDYVHGL